MMQKVKQREPIESFINFVNGFLITDGATIQEIELVEANLEILKERIQEVKNSTLITWRECEKEMDLQGHKKIQP